MKIIQISDFHVKSDSTIANYQQKISCLVETIKKEVPGDESLLILVCGDIVDKGDPLGYPIAADILRLIEKGLANYNVRFEFAPGNHEINKNAESKLEDFGKFIRPFDGLENNISNLPVVVKNHEGINFVIMNSCYKYNPDYGEVDLRELEKAAATLNGPIVWVAHHTLFSRYDEDESSIRNSHALIECMLKYNSIAYIHGHTHGYSDITIGRKCKVVGVGPLFKPVADISNQFNILSVSGTWLIRIDNYCYRADTNSFVKQTLYENLATNYFEGTSLVDTYTESVQNVKSSNAITNFHFHLRCHLDDFRKDVEKFFSREIELAKLWLQEELPDCMYYNHAKYINKGSKPGMEYIISELTDKSTSSRAIIPLINMADVVGSGDNHLPSLDVIQFGFDDELRTTLNVTVYLRALEVNHFLKINISEIYHLVSVVCDKIRSVQWFNLNIIAFRAQYKEKFGCFMKAKIDFISPHKLTAIIMKHDISTLIEMLVEKKDLAETVVNDDGIKSFAAALLETKNGEQYDVYNQDVIGVSQKLVKLYDELRCARKRTSIHAEIERIENEISSRLDEMVSLLKKIEGDNENH